MLMLECAERAWVTLISRKWRREREKFDRRV